MNCYKDYKRESEEEKKHLIFFFFDGIQAIFKPRMFITTVDET